MSISHYRERRVKRMRIAAEDASFLIQQIRLGEAIVVLGAGASVGGHNQQGQPIKGGKQLAQLLAERVGIEYSDESLSDTYEAVKQRLSDVQLHRLLSEEYTGTTAGPAVRKLLRFAWRRLYTFNVDDSLDNLPFDKGHQRRAVYNNMIDKVADHKGPGTLQVIYLHGQALKPEHKLVFSETEFAKALRNSHMHWYKEAGTDYISYCPIFIGSSLNERVLWAEIERAKRDNDSTTGQGFAITPDTLTPLRRASLEARGIKHVQATLEEFVDWLISGFPGGLGPRDVAFTDKDAGKIDDITIEDVNAAYDIVQIDPRKALQDLSRLRAHELDFRGRQFYRGFPPTWIVAASDIPVWLQGCAQLLGSLQVALVSDVRLFVVAGQAGSGKTTATMMSLLRSADGVGRRIYELRGGNSSIGAVITVLRKLEEKCVLYIPDLLLYGDSLVPELEKMSDDRIVVVTSARSSEWSNHYSRSLGRYAHVEHFQRFGRMDYGPLTKQLLAYVASPKFMKMKQSERESRLASSKQQLLIALHEATEFGSFGDTISHEFGNLPHRDARTLFLIAGIATMARVGVTSAMAQEAFYRTSPEHSFGDTFAALAGIVEKRHDGRLFARHEVYVRHVLWNDVEFDEYVSALKALLTSFSKYEVPVIAKVSKIEGALFKYLLNSDKIYDVAFQHRSLVAGTAIYENFENEFQLDGHFWLQYGLYEIKVGRPEDALRLFKNSIDAYPDTPRRKMIKMSNH